MDTSLDMSSCRSPCPKQTRTRTCDFLELRTRTRTWTKYNKRKFYNFNFCQKSENFQNAITFFPELSWTNGFFFLDAERAKFSNIEGSVGLDCVGLSKNFFAQNGAKIVLSMTEKRKRTFYCRICEFGNPTKF